MHSEIRRTLMKRTRLKRKQWSICLAIAIGSCTAGYANPQGFQLIAGEAAEPAVNGNTLQITTGDKAIIHWDNFSIAAGEVTRFVQPSPSATVLNRVMHGDPSALFGTLEANGKVLLINPNGILVGEGACINTASFIASTFDLINEAFMKGEEMTFAGHSNASVVNLGTINAWDGDVLLIACQVKNDGKVEAPKGTVALAAGREILLKPMGTQRIFIRAMTSEGSVDNSGEIQALHAELKAEGEPYAFAIRNSGQIIALGTKESNGHIYLTCDHGEIALSGQLTAEEGDVRLLADTITLLNPAKIDVSGEKGGGQVLMNAEGIYVEEGVKIAADALKEGHGGKVILWANTSNHFFGEISAQGGQNSGNGGFVEVSSPGTLLPNGIVNTLAPAGQTGMFLIDPINVTISSSANSTGYTAAAAWGLSGSVSPANINTTTLQNQLARTNVTINTSAANYPGDAGDITVTGNVSWSAATNLTLIASEDITIQSMVTSTSTGAITLTAARNITVGGAGASSDSQVTCHSGSLTLNAGGVLNLAAENYSAILSTEIGGDISIATGGVNLQGGTTSGAAALIQANFTSGTNSISINSTSTQAPISLTGGTAADTYAIIQAGGNINLGNTQAVGAVTLLGGSADGAVALISSSAGAVSLLSAGALSLTGANGTAACIESFGPEGVSVTAASVALAGGSGTSNSSSWACVYSSAGPVSVTSTSTDITVGSTGMQDEALIYTDTSGGNVTVTSARDVIIQGGNTGGVASIYSDVPGATVSVTASGNLTLQGGSASGSYARISSVGDLSAITSKAISLIGNSQIISSSGNMIVTAGTDLFIGTGSTISNTGSGNLTITVDNKVPFPARFGTGKFTLQQGATLSTSGGLLRIFTSARRLNSISAPINGRTFSPGALFQNSDTEVWGDPSFSGDTDCIVFYKESPLIIDELSNFSSVLISAGFYVWDDPDQNFQPGQVGAVNGGFRRRPGITNNTPL